MITYVTQWLGSDGNWRESIGAGSDGSDQQGFYAGKAGAEKLSMEGAWAFAQTLIAAGSYGAERVRIVERTERVIEIRYATDIEPEN